MYNNDDYDFETYFKNGTKKGKRQILIKPKKKIPLDSETGRIIELYGKKFIVESLSVPNQKIECTLSGTLSVDNPDSSLVSVGDNVIFTRATLKDSSEYEGVILKILERKSLLARRAVGKEPTEHVLASNIDNAIIFMSAANPFYNRRLIDRIIIASELGGIRPIVCINKIDLIAESEIGKNFSVYNGLGIPVLFMSALTGKGIVKFRKKIKNCSNVLVGPSGAGKSTLINKLFGYEVAGTNEISDRTGKGIHTTSYSQLLKLPNGTEIIDTPGIREFGIWGLELNELPLYFHEFDQFHPKCKFISCSHIHEPGCAVIEAVEAGLLDIDRYESYLNIYNSLV